MVRLGLESNLGFGATLAVVKHMAFLGTPAHVLVLTLLLMRPQILFLNVECPAGSRGTCANLLVYACNYACMYACMYARIHINPDLKLGRIHTSPVSPHDVETEIEISGRLECSVLKHDCHPQGLKLCPAT